MLVQKLRLQRGWSQEQLAEISGLSVRTIQRIERGQPGSLESCKALAAVFDIDLDRLRETSMDAAHPSELRADEALALAHVRKVKRFYIHLVQYVVVICVLAVVNVVTRPTYFWFIWPALGWGIGLFFHAAGVFDMIPFLGAEWERRSVERRLGRKLT